VCVGVDAHDVVSESLPFLQCYTMLSYVPLGPSRARRHVCTTVRRACCHDLRWISDAVCARLVYAVHDAPVYGIVCGVFAPCGHVLAMLSCLLCVICCAAFPVTIRYFVVRF